jgi:hypothetical protein
MSSDDTEEESFFRERYAQERKRKNGSQALAATLEVVMKWLKKEEM